MEPRSAISPGSAHRPVGRSSTPHDQVLPRGVEDPTGSQPLGPAPGHHEGALRSPTQGRPFVDVACASPVTVLRAPLSRVYPPCCRKGPHNFILTIPSPVNHLSSYEKKFGTGASQKNRAVGTFDTSGSPLQTITLFCSVRLREACDRSTRVDQSWYSLQHNHFWNDICYLRKRAQGSL